jgi:hypothetical protein
MKNAVPITVATMPRGLSKRRSAIIFSAVAPSPGTCSSAGGVVVTVIDSFAGETACAHPITIVAEKTTRAKNATPLRIAISSLPDLSALLYGKNKHKIKIVGCQLKRLKAVPKTVNLDPVPPIGQNKFP